MTDKEKIIAYIDKLLEKYPKNYYLLMVAEFIDHLQEEPANEDLEEAAKKYGTKKHPMTTTGANESAYDFKAGSKWQKEQMMTKAVDADMVVDRIGEVTYICPHTKATPYEKVKVIIIKEG